MTPARQRDYAAEYAARKERAAERDTTVYREREKVGGAVERLGFKSYGEYRGAAEGVKKDLERLAQQGVWDAPVPKPGSAIHNLMMQAAALIRHTPAKERQTADRKGESILARTKKGRALREQLRSALGWKDGPGWGSRYFPAMRALY